MSGHDRDACYVAKELSTLSALADALVAEYILGILRLADVFVTALTDRGTLYFAATAAVPRTLNIAAEYMVKLGHDRKPIPAVALTTDTSYLPAQTICPSISSSLARFQSCAGHLTSSSCIRRAATAPTCCTQLRLPSRFRCGQSPSWDAEADNCRRLWITR